MRTVAFLKLFEVVFVGSCFELFRVFTSCYELLRVITSYYELLQLVASCYELLQVLTSCYEFCLVTASPLTPCRRCFARVGMLISCSSSGRGLIGTRGSRDMRWRGSREGGSCRTDSWTEAEDPLVHTASTTRGGQTVPPEQAYYSTTILITSSGFMGGAASTMSHYARYVVIFWYTSQKLPGSRSQTYVQTLRVAPHPDLESDFASGFRVAPHPNCIVAPRVWVWKVWTWVAPWAAKVWTHQNLVAKVWTWVWDFDPATLLLQWKFEDDARIWLVEIIIESKKKSQRFQYKQA